MFWFIKKLWIKNVCNSYCKASKVACKYNFIENIFCINVKDLEWIFNSLMQDLSITINSKQKQIVLFSYQKILDLCSKSNTKTFSIMDIAWILIQTNLEEYYWPDFFIENIRTIQGMVENYDW